MNDVTRLAILLLLTAGALTFVGCAGEPGPSEGELEMTKEQAAASRADWFFDPCDWYGWYGDGECDDFCSEPDPDCQQCPDPDPPEGSRLTCHMVQFLQAGPSALGEGEIVVDAAALFMEDAEGLLVEMGWRHEGEAEDGGPVYKIGDPGLYRHGQNVVLYADGSVALASFASNYSVPAAPSFVETIALDAAGAVTSHQLRRLP